MAVSNQQSRDAALLRATTELFALSARHDADEIRRFEELATHFLGKVTPGDRAFVAERLAKTPDAPASVLRMLGKDLVEIAAPILRRSAALSEIDLLSIISATGPQHHRLIARRANLPAPVVTALRLAGDSETADLLAAYPQAAPLPAATPAPQPLPAPPPEIVSTSVSQPASGALEPAAPAILPPTALARDPDAREVFSVARAMTAALSVEMTTLATFAPRLVPAAVQAPAATPHEVEAAAERIEPPAMSAMDIDTPPDAGDVSYESAVEPRSEAEAEPDIVPAGDTAIAISGEANSADAIEDPAEDDEAAVAGVPAITSFLSLDARGRFESLVRLLGRAGPADPGMTVIDADNAFRVALGSARVSQHARRRQREALIQALAEGLRLDVASVREIADDPSGEALVVLVRAIGLSEAEAHQVLLFANPVIGEAMETFFRLARLSGELGREAAERVVASWRGDIARMSGHRPIHSEIERRRSSAPHKAQRSDEEAWSGVTDRRLRN
ncbi:MAG: DUF2336 domain-containing protein [Rhizobiales bacterium]|nr:DUF2336 domain-containing protein [Hyphomicrobiales bacterium]